MGELPLQHYNNLLCISHLNEFVDSICLHQNDDILSIIEKISNVETNKTTGPKNTLNPLTKKINENNTNYNSISINDMNRYIVKSFLSVIYPVESVSLKQQSIGMESLEMYRFLCSNPNLKFIELYNVNNQTNSNISNNNSSTGNKTNPILKNLLSIIPKYNRNQTEQFASLNSLLISRGAGQDSAATVVWHDYDFIRKNLNPVDWNPFTVDFWSAKHVISDDKNNNTKSINCSSSLTIATNRNKCVEYLKEIMNKAHLKYSAKAYLHWYWKFNITNENFDIAFENVKQIIDSYELMTRKNY